MNNTKLIAITKPVDGLPTNEGFVEYCARVSNPDNQLKTMKTGKLINYLIDHEHWSPFEMMHAVFEINTTRDIATQILRHRSFSFQQFSLRYSKGTGFTLRDTRIQASKNRQSSVINQSIVRHVIFKYSQLLAISLSSLLYKLNLLSGVAREQARCILPMGNTNTRLYMSGSIRSWIHYVELRSQQDTQAEHRQIALEIGETLRQYFPNCF